MRFFIPLALVDGIATVARAGYDLYTGADAGSFWARVAADIRGHTIIATHSSGGAQAFASLLVVVVEPIVGGALIAMTSALYLGRPTSFGQAYRTALARAFPLALIAATFLAGSVVFIVLVAVLIAIGVLVASGIAALGGFWRSAAIAIGVLLGIVCAVTFVIAAAATALAWSLSSIVCVLEGASPMRAIARSARRFVRTRVRRTLLVAAANFAIPVGSFFVASVSDAGLPFLHGSVVAILWQSVMGSVAALLGTAFGCIFYYDLRVREEGYDLRLDALELQRLAETAVGEVSSTLSPKRRHAWK